MHKQDNFRLSNMLWRKLKYDWYVSPEGKIDLDWVVFKAFTEKMTLNSERLVTYVWAESKCVYLSKCEKSFGVLEEKGIMTIT